MAFNLTTRDVKVFLDSEKAYSKPMNNNSSSIFQMDPVLKVRGFKVNNFSMYNTIYTVHEGNNIMSFTFNGNDYSVSLPTGFYESGELADFIQSSINTSLTQNVTVTYSRPQAKYTITGFTSPARYNSALSSANIITGFTVDQTGTSLVSNDIAESNPVDYFYITSTALGQISQVIIPGTPFNNVIQKIVVDNTIGYLIEYVNYSEVKFSSESSVSLSSIDINILDKNFKPIPGQPRWSMELQFDQVILGVNPNNLFSRDGLNRSQNYQNSQNNPNSLNNINSSSTVDSNFSSQPINYNNANVNSIRPQISGLDNLDYR